MFVASDKYFCIGLVSIHVEVVQKTCQELWKLTLTKGIIKVNVFLIIELGKV
jgi:hypothetical protein